MQGKTPLQGIDKQEKQLFFRTAVKIKMG